MVYLGNQMLFISQAVLVQHSWQGMAGLLSPLSDMCCRQLWALEMP